MCNGQKGKSDFYFCTLKHTLTLVFFLSFFGIAINKMPTWINMSACVFMKIMSSETVGMGKGRFYKYLLPNKFLRSLKKDGYITMCIVYILQLTVNSSQ